MVSGSVPGADEPAAAAQIAKLQPAKPPRIDKAESPCHWQPHPRMSMRRHGPPGVVTSRRPVMPRCTIHCAAGFALSRSRSLRVPVRRRCVSQCGARRESRGLRVPQPGGPAEFLKGSRCEPNQASHDAVAAHASHSRRGQWSLPRAIPASSNCRREETRAGATCARRAPGSAGLKAHNLPRAWVASRRRGYSGRLPWMGPSGVAPCTSARRSPVPWFRKTAPCGRRCRAG